MASPDLLEQLWRDQFRWSELAGQMKRRIENARAVALVLVVVVAVLGTASASTTGFGLPSRLLAGGAAVGAALIPVLRSRWSGAAIRDWTRARSASETLKSYVYQWLAEGEPSDQAARRSLQDQVDALRTDVADLRPQADAVDAPDRPLPAVHDPASYFDVRVTGQINSYYRPRAAELKKRLDRLDLLGLVLAILGALLGGAAALVGSGIAAWIAVVTTIATAVSAHVAATRYRYQRLEFLRTAERLSQLRDRAAATSSPAELHDLIKAAEDAVTAENQAWMAKLARDEIDAAA